MYKQQSLFPEFDVKSEDKTSVTFADNMKLPIHRWYRYTAGFSGAWVGQVIEKEKRNNRVHIIDPFVGSGTVAIESTNHGVEAYGLESNPYVYRIANAKLKWNIIRVEDIKISAQKLLDTAMGIKNDVSAYPNLILRCFHTETLIKLDSLKSACLAMPSGEEKDFMWFVITSILRSTSPVGTAQWQYIQPNKKKAKVLDPYEAFWTKIQEICFDIHESESIRSNHNAVILNQDARGEVDIPDNWGDLVITSPPYANNYDYADAMRLEMLFWGDIDGWNGLKNVSSHLVRACTQHVSNLKTDVEPMINSPLIEPIRDELVEKYKLLEEERANHGGRKNYHYMILAYFYDLSRVFKMLNQKTTDNCKMCLVIGDSAPYGIYIPVDEWLGRLAVNAGFRGYSFEKIRDRNVKWKNRKHRVPLKEGRLWINK